MLRPWLAAAGAAATAVGAAVSQLDEGIVPPPSVDAAQLIVAVGALLFVSIVADLVPRARAGRGIERAGTRLAAFSYTLYLTHFPVLAALRVLGWMALCLVVVLGTYVPFKRQTPRARRWLRKLLSGRTPHTAPETGRSRNPARAYQRA